MTKDAHVLLLVCLFVLVVILSHIGIYYHDQSDIWQKRYHNHVQMFPGASDTVKLTIIYRSTSKYVDVSGHFLGNRLIPDSGYAPHTYFLVQE